MAGQTRQPTAGTQAIDSAGATAFADAVLCWYDRHGRKNLPWQKDVTPYRVWVSEIMLQQTRVATAIDYYDRFMHRFPQLADLAQAPLDAVLAHWSGLGYYARARNLHQCAQLVVARHGGKLPATLAELIRLPGIGRSTAGAILSLACGQRQAILDGNVKRILTRYLAIEGWPGSVQTARELWACAGQLTPQRRVAHYTQALMDMGATLCTRSAPDCRHCPLRDQCLAYRQNRTAELPHRKPKKSLPVRPRYMLLLENCHGEVLLEKRPPTGIWGGLLAPPVFTDPGQLSDWQRQHFQRAECLGEWPVHRHTLSHFHMDITPAHYRTSDEVAGIMEAGQYVWYKDGASLVGLPAPVSRFLQQLATRHATGA